MEHTVDMRRDIVCLEAGVMFTNRGYGHAMSCMCSVFHQFVQHKQQSKHWTMSQCLVLEHLTIPQTESSEFASVLAQLLETSTFEIIIAISDM